MIWLVLAPITAVVFFLGYVAGSVLSRFEPDLLEGAVPALARGKNFSSSQRSLAPRPRHP